MDYQKCLHWRVCNLCCPYDLKDCRHYIPSGETTEAKILVKVKVAQNSMGRCENIVYHVCGNCGNEVGLNDNYCSKCGKRLVLEGN